LNERNIITDGLLESSLGVDMGKDWRFGNVGSSSHGLMICSCCNKKIDKGDYLYRTNKNDDAFITTHRHCIADHKIWKEVDQKRTSWLTEITERLEAYEAFAKKWDTAALDEDIERLRDEIERNKTLW